MQVSEFLRQADGLFVLPESVSRLKACMDDGASSMDNVADIINYDPALAAQILKVVNSALYRFPAKVTSIAKAVQIMGTRAAYDLAIGYGVSRAFSELHTQAIDLDKFWEQSVSCGLLAKYFASEQRIKDQESFFVAGLLHNIGELAILAIEPELAKRCANLVPSQLPHQLQRDVLGFSYCDLSVALLKHWDLPEEIYYKVWSVSQIGTQSRSKSCSIMKLAYVLSLENVYADVYESYANLPPYLCENLVLERDDLEDALDITNLQCISVLSLFDASNFNATSV